MKFQSTSCHIRTSCYNCTHFRINNDMLNGYCHYYNKQKSALGTCQFFSTKIEENQRLNKSFQQY